jgi:formylmethanofuran dehydrogenase subunit E
VREGKGPDFGLPNTKYGGVKMTQCTIKPELIQEAICFHGHSCPGLAVGIRVAELMLQQFEPSSDEEIVCVVETDMCAVDAIQYLTGCTLGKGNLIHLDHGKSTFTFYDRSDGRSIRIVLRPGGMGKRDKTLDDLRKKKVSGDITTEEEERLSGILAGRIEGIMGATLDELFEVKEAQFSIPKKAARLDSLTCEACGEATMESRTRRFLGQTLCIPCFEVQEKRVN